MNHHHHRRWEQLRTRTQGEASDEEPGETTRRQANSPLAFTKHRRYHPAHKLPRYRLHKTALGYQRYLYSGAELRSGDVGHFVERPRSSLIPGGYSGYNNENRNPAINVPIVKQALPAPQTFEFIVETESILVALSHERQVSGIVDLNDSYIKERFS